MTALDWNFSLESPNLDSDCEAYVGLREKGSKVTLRVPYGYPTGNDFQIHEKSAILGELMRAIARFSDAFPEEKTSKRDGFLQGNDGGSAVRGPNGAGIGYSSLQLYVELIRQLLDPRLLALTKAPGLTTQFDHRQISRNLHRATFLPDGTPVFDHLWAPRVQMRHTANDMVGLACWLALDGLDHLFPQSAGREIGAALRSEWDELARRFADDHGLPNEASLFSTERGDTLRELQTALETCLRRAPPVSSDARALSHLLDDLLNRATPPSGGCILGLKGFYHVWEAACLEHAIKQYGLENVFTCDYTYLAGIDPATRTRWDANRKKVFEANGLSRRPDLVVSNADGRPYLIVDFKYQLPEVPKSRPCAPDFDLCDIDTKRYCREVKAAQDIANVEAYRWLLMQKELLTFDESKVQLELWMPSDGEPPPQTCEWMTELRLSIAYKQARKIIGAYAGNFSLLR